MTRLKATPVLLASAALALSVVSFLPAAGAQTACTVDAWTWHTDYDCHVVGVGGSGTLVWCPDFVFCFDMHIIGCAVDLTPPWYCWV